MSVKLTKHPLNKLGRPLRFVDTITANCLLGVHIGFPIRRGTVAYTEPCDGFEYGGMRGTRACMCNCHTER